MRSGSAATKVDRGEVAIRYEECKGCGLCIAACPVACIRISDALNGQGYCPAVYVGQGCTGCGICFYVCPEPGAVAVFIRGKGREAEVKSTTES